MPFLIRVLFPPLACFGPLFMVLGLQGPKGPMDHELALAGALMTSVALIFLFIVMARMQAPRR
jgi:hypothetical protein